MSRWDSGSTCLLILTRAPIAPHSVGELAQLGERLVCNQEVTGSSPVFSTSLRPAALKDAGLRLGKQVWTSPGRKAGRSLRRSGEAAEADGFFDN